MSKIQPLGALSAALLSCVVASSAPKQDAFVKDIRPLLETYCVKCHGAALQTAGINFTRFTDSTSILHDLPLWRKVLEKLQSGEMPPAKPLPAPEERERLVTWVEDQLQHPDWDKVKNAGEVTLPRLNRTEYNNTIRDLTGIDLRPADAFPPDGQGKSGFNNDREGLFLSPLLVEKYLAAADSVVDEVVAARRNSQPFATKLEVEDMRITETGTPKKPYGYDVVVTQNTIYDYVRFPRTGTYTFRVRAWGRSDKPGYLPAVALRVAGELVGQEQVAASAEQPGTYTFTGLIKRGSRRVSLHYFPTRSDVPPLTPSAKPNPDSRPVLSLDWLEIADAPAQRAIENGSKVFTSSDPRQILDRFASRAWRRPATRAEVDVLFKSYQQSRQKGAPFEDAVGAGLKAVLVSPFFLFRVENSGSSSAYRLNDYELASRLSYFLWMSMPDDELFRLAREKRLRQPGVLEQQVRRMTKDPKADAFIDQFFGQWLGYGELARTGGPDRKTFPVFTDYLRDSMLAESNLFFGSLVREDQSLLKLLDADYTYLNEDLARHYGVPDVLGRQLRKVSLQDRNRGGVVGMGSILTATSLPVRTSPVLRGKWLLEVMLGETIPPPPANAGDLPEPSKETAAMTIRQRFEMHRKAEQCASCHNRIDPLGYGLENFDAVGRWRDKDNGQLVDSPRQSCTRRAALQHGRVRVEVRENRAAREKALFAGYPLWRDAEFDPEGSQLRYFGEQVNDGRSPPASTTSSQRPSRPSPRRCR